MRCTIKTKYHYSFLSILWIVIGSCFVLFQNNSEDLSSSAFHNEQCSQAHQSNETKVYQLGGLQADLLSQWPDQEAEFKQYLTPVIQSIQDLSLELYSYCKTGNEAVEPSEVQKLALIELEKVTNSEANGNWKNYLSTLEKSLEKLKGMN